MQTYLLAALAAALLAKQAPDNGKTMNYIDSHVHVWTDDTARYPLGPGWAAADMRPPRFTPEDLFKHTKPAGVGRIVLVQMSYYVPKSLTSKIGNGFDNDLTI